MDNGCYIVAWLKYFSDTEGNKNKYAYSWLLRNAKLSQPMIPIGIVVYVFMLLWSNLRRNNCKWQFPGLGYWPSYFTSRCIFLVYKQIGSWPGQIFHSSLHHRIPSLVTQTFISISLTLQMKTTEITCICFMQHSQYDEEIVNQSFIRGSVLTESVNFKSFLQKKMFTSFSQPSPISNIWLICFWKRSSERHLGPSFNYNTAIFSDIATFAC